MNDMNQVQQERLKSKLVDTCIHLSKTKQDKRESLAGFTDEIKGSEKRIEALSEAIKNHDFQLLHGTFSEVEIDHYMQVEP